MIAMIKLSNLFKIEYGTSLSLNKLNVKKTHDTNTVNFVSRTAKNNGISAIVEKIEGITPLEAGLITVAVSGSVLETFVQPMDFYTGYHVMILKPKIDMDIRLKLFYCMCIKTNKYRYSYGRQANKTLKDILVPSPDEIPSWVYEVEIPDYSNVTKPYLDEPTPALNVEEWKEFRLDELFEISASKNISNKEASGNPGDIPYITTTGDNNGVQQYTSIGPFYDGKCLTVAGSGTIFATFYQNKPFTTSQRLYILKPLFKINSYIAMFLIPLIEQEGYRFSYGRQVKIGHVRDMVIKLPATPEGNPDWEWMEKYIKTLRWSSEV